jgi:histidine triad (HIT) family protein
MSDCPFCRIASHRTPGAVIYEDDEVMAFLDTRPIRRGHTQVISKRHVESFDELPPELAGRIVGVGQRLARTMKSVYEVERVAFLFTGGDVPHVQAHVVPMHHSADITSVRYIEDAAVLRATAEELTLSPIS